MPLRWHDPALWFNLPGVVACYQSVAAPDALSALRNMARGGDGRYTAAPGVAPTWNSATGWTFNGSTQYLTTGVAPHSNTSAVASFLSISGTGGAVIGREVSANLYTIQPQRLGGLVRHRWGDSQRDTSATLTSGTAGYASKACYINGVLLGNVASSVTMMSSDDVWIGGANSSGSLTMALNGKVKAVMLVDRVLSAAEMWLANMQMAYCEANSAWNVWAPRRRWFFILPPTPAAATPVLSTIYINTADINDTSLFDSVSGAAVSSTYARTGTNSFELGGSDYLQADLTSSATKYSKFGLLVTATPGADALLCAWQEDGTEHVSLYLTDKLTLQMRQGSTIIQTSPTTLETATWYCVETKVVVHTATGRFQVRIDGVDDMSAIGINTDADVDGAINEIRFESPVDDTYIDDIVVREDQWCGTGGVNVIVPTAAGTVEEWTGDYADVDDLPPSFTDYIDVTTESGSDQTFRHGGLSGGYDVDVVGVFAKGKLDAESAEIQFYALVRSALVDNVGYAQTLDTIGVYARLLMTTDPNGTVAWTTHTVNNALQIGVRA